MKYVLYILITTLAVLMTIFLMVMISGLFYDLSPLSINYTVLISYAVLFLIFGPGVLFLLTANSYSTSSPFTFRRWLIYILVPLIIPASLILNVALYSKSNIIGVIPRCEEINTSTITSDNVDIQKGIDTAREACKFNPYLSTYSDARQERKPVVIAGIIISSIASLTITIVMCLRASRNLVYNR